MYYVVEIPSFLPSIYIFNADNIQQRFLKMYLKFTKEIQIFIFEERKEKSYLKEILDNHTYTAFKTIFSLLKRF